jgi:hypothetical protein
MRHIERHADEGRLERSQQVQQEDALEPIHAMAQQQQHGTLIRTGPCADSMEPPHASDR